MDRTTKVFSVITLLVAALAYQMGGWDLVFAGIKRGLDTLITVAVLIVAAYATAGLAGVLISQESIKNYLGREAGWRGLLIGMAAGAITPGGPYVYYPIARAISSAGVGFATVFTFLTSKGIWDLSRLPMELAILGPRITLIRWLVTSFIPPVLAYIAYRLDKQLEPFLPTGGED